MPPTPPAASIPPRLRVDVPQLVRARLVGMALLSVIVLVHNRFVVAGYTTRWSLLVGAVLLGYAAIAGGILQALATHRALGALVELFFALDLVLWAFAIYAT